MTLNFAKIVKLSWLTFRRLYEADL